MSHIIAGDPAPTNPTPPVRSAMTAGDRLRVMIRNSHGSMTVWSEPEIDDAFDAYRAEVLAERDAKLLCSALNLGEGSDAFIADYDARKRAEVLAEAVEAARSKRLTNALFGSDIAYNNGVTDAVAAIGALIDGGESRG